MVNRYRNLGATFLDSKNPKIDEQFKLWYPGLWKIFDFKNLT